MPVFRFLIKAIRLNQARSQTDFFVGKKGFFQDLLSIYFKYK